MTPPKPLPPTAKNAIKQLNRWNRLDVQAFLCIAMAAARGDTDTVIALAEAGAERNLTALSAGIYAASGAMVEADEEIMDYTRKHRKSEQ